MRYFDAHAHVQFPPFDTDREEILQQMEEAGVGAVMVGVDRASSEAAIALVTGRKNLYAAVGVHPNDSPKEKFDTDVFRELAKHPSVIALGECGLDYYRQEDTEAEKTRQKELFKAHIETAVLVDKPLIIHARPSKGTVDAYQDIIEILREAKDMHGERLRGDIHFFVGGVPEAEAFIGLGFTLSFTAVLTFTSDYDEVVRAIPLSSILSETDAPYIAPEGRRGKRNDPLATIDVVSAIARIRGEDEEVVRETVLANALKLFSL